jgi:hypothetical protein
MNLEFALVAIRLFLVSFTIMASILMVFEIISELSKPRKKTKITNGYMPFKKKIDDDSDKPKLARLR